MARVTTLRDFPGAPRDAVLSEEGWLVTGDAGWTVEDWRSTAVSERPHAPRRHPNPPAPYATEDERRAARAAAKRRWNEKQRADPHYRGRERAVDRERRRAQRRAQREVAA